MLTRFFHLRIAADGWVSTTGGATVRVVQQNPGDTHVDVQATRCSIRDIYQRKLGRECAEKAPITSIPLADLPKYIAEQHRRACKESGAVRWALRPGDFAFSVLYFLRQPKQ